MQQGAWSNLIDLGNLNHYCIVSFAVPFLSHSSLRWLPSAPSNSQISRSKSFPWCKLDAGCQLCRAQAWSGMQVLQEEWGSCPELQKVIQIQLPRMCGTEIFFVYSLLRIVKFKISHGNANAKNSHLFAKYANYLHIFAKLYIFVYN